MMRSDMPKQIMAYRNGGGIPSLATVPMETNISGEPHQLSYITPFEANLLRGLGGSGTPGPGGVPQYAGVYETLFGKPFSDTAVGQALGMEHSGTPPGFSPSEEAATANTARTSAQQRLSDLNSASKRRKKKRRRRAEAAAAAAAAEQQEASATTTVDSGITTLGPNGGANNPDIMNAAITNMVAGRDDLNAQQKLEFAQSLANSYGLTDSSGVQSAVDNLSTVALDPTSSLSDAERVDALTSLGTYSGTDYSGLINTLNDQIATNNIATTTPGADLIDNLGSTSPGEDLIDNLGSSDFTYNPITVPEAVSYTGYSPIVPSPNIIPAGIMGLPSTGMNTGTNNPYAFTAYTPGTYNPAGNPLVLPPLG